jgi:hypothetical protein
MLMTRFKDHPILWAWLVIFFAEAGMNVMFGLRFGGLFYASIFGAMAVLGAYMADKLFEVRGQSLAAWGQRFKYGLPTLVAILLSQVSGWSVMGVTISDGLAAREIAADGSADLRAQLKAKRDALAKRSDVATASEIETQIAALMAVYVSKGKGTVGELTEQCAKPDWAPVTCRKVAELRATLAQAGTAAALPAEITALQKRLDEAGATGSSGAQLDVLTTLTGATTDQAKFGLSLLFVAAVGLFSNLGLALIGGRAEPEAMTTGWSYGPPRLAGPAQAYAAADAYGAPEGYGARDMGPMPEGPRPGGRPPVARPHPLDLPDHAGGALTAGGAQATMHAAPINIYMGSEPQRAAAQAPSAAVRAGALPALAGNDAAGQPIDRNGVNELTDQLLAFRAARLADMPGSSVPSSHLYEAYQSWSGPRAIARAAFDTMFPAVTRLQPVLFGGQAHYRGVALVTDAQARPVRLVAI